MPSANTQVVDDMRLLGRNSAARPAPFHRPAPPGETLAPMAAGDPLLGHLRQLRGDALGLLTRAQREHGDIVRLHFGPVVAHSISSPELVRIVLSDRARSFGSFKRGNDLSGLVLGNGLLTADGETWLRNRRIAAPAFHQARI